MRQFDDPMTAVYYGNRQPATTGTKTQFASISNIVIQMSNFVNVQHKIGTTHL